MGFDLHQEMANRLGVPRTTAKKMLFTASFASVAQTFPNWLRIAMRHGLPFDNRAPTPAECTDLDTLARQIKPFQEFAESVDQPVAADQPFIEITPLLGYHVIRVGGLQFLVEVKASSNELAYLTEQMQLEVDRYVETRRSE